MARRFQIGELRTLVARALNEGDYAPAVSARVRAVPDTRTIRYYTTLGLLKPPSELRGRVAYYDETHVLQIVAIKQLQSQNVSLSDIQQRLIGLAPRKLEAIAKLPEDFWPAADKYLAKLATKQTTEADKPDESDPFNEADDKFWLTPAAIPTKLNNDAAYAATAEIPKIIRLTLTCGITLTIELPQGSKLSSKLDIHSLLSAAQPLVEELRRQNMLDD